MPLLEGKCPNCGGLIQFDSNTKGGICPFCSTSYLAQDITNYNTYNIHSAMLNVDPSATISQKIKNAETFLTDFKNYKKAEEIFTEVTELKADDYRGWWGLVRVHTQEFAKTDIGTKTLFKINTYVTYAKKVADSSAKAEIESIWQAYLDKNNEWRKPHEQTLQMLESRLATIENKESDVKNTRNSLQQKLNSYTADLAIVQKISSNYYTLAGGFLLFVLSFALNAQWLLIFALGLFAVNVGFFCKCLLMEKKQRDIFSEFSTTTTTIFQLSAETANLHAQIKEIQTMLSE